MLCRRDDKGLISAFVFLVGCGVFMPVQLSHAMTVRIVPHLLKPGEAFMVAVSPGSPVTDVTGEVFGKKLYFLKRGETYFSLSGVDLFQDPGRYPLVIAAGRDEAKKNIRVVKKRFGKEVLHLPPEAVFLSPQDLERVEKEKKELDTIWREEAPEILWNGAFILPVKGVFGSGFGLRRIINGEERSPHMGQDIKAPEGTPVLACNSGRVIFIGEQFFSGKSIVIDHGQGLFSMYFHLSDVAVKEGDVVGKEQVIGRVGSTGRASGPHLHWGVRLQGRRVDPLSLLGLPLNENPR